MVKTTKPMVRIHNAETGEVIDREMTDAEFAEHQANQVVKATAQAEADAKAEARQAILDRLGITADEAAILLG
jgi:hypothetical protein